MQKRRCAAFAALTLLIAGPAGAASVNEQVKYFTIRGSTPEELDRDLSRSGPLVAETGLHHPGTTQVTFSGRVTYRTVPAGCAVDTAALKLDLTVTLPRWRPSRKPSKRMALIWKTLENDIRRHEAEHGAIARLWLKKMESAIRNLSAERDCETMQETVGAVTARYIADHDQAQIRFDAVEAREINDRLRRAFEAALAQSEAAGAAAKETPASGRRK
ncbi:DUF922 domain-containing protein [Mangrovicella endophytica]|uniref:DUF922 domain-containing protein n=1 Tax=Mangrovicella endophytica TaxID=2066697 RepID=UPI0013000C34|nr:DUF922 domain-containing protein [Mangrovicella endophytica]